MKAHNVTISIPILDQVCDKNCEYCVARMTGYIEHDDYLFTRNLVKLRTLARAAHVTNVLLTSKGETLLNEKGVWDVANTFRDYPLEIQTNGYWLNESKDIEDGDDKVVMLHQAGIDVVAISVDTLKEIREFTELFEAISKMNMTVRLCVNLTDKISEAIKFKDLMCFLRLRLVDQLVIRRVSVPSHICGSPGCDEAVNWISLHADSRRYDSWHFESTGMRHDEHDKIERLPHGVEVHDINGIAVSFSDYCVQEYNDTKDIRSLIYLEDGHCYTSWDKMSSRKF